MRPTLLALVIVVSGCSDTGSAPIRYRSTLQASTRGLVLHDGGVRGHAGMFETNCPFETVGGSVTGDYELPDQGESVEDAGDSTLGEETVVLAMPDRVHLLEKSTGYYSHVEVPWSGIDTVRIAEDGLVGLVTSDDGCAVEWVVDDEIVSHVDVGICDPTAFDVEPDGIAVLGGPSVIFVDPDGGITATEEPGRLVAVDDVLGHAYVAEPGGDTVSAVRSDGTQVWTATIAGAIRGLSAAGARGAAVVTVERADGTGVIDWLDGETGELVAEVDTPSAAPTVRSSPDGDVLALVLPEQVYFFQVDLDALSVVRP